MQWERRKKPDGRWVKMKEAPTDLAELDHEAYDYRAHGHREPEPPGPESVPVQLGLEDFPDPGYTTSIELHSTAEGPKLTFVGVGMSPTPIDEHFKEFPFYSDSGALWRDQETGEIVNRNGVTARLLKKLSHTAILKAALEKLNREDPYDYPVVDEAIAQIRAGLKGSRTQTRDDAFKANLAAAYVGEVAATGGRGVYVRLAEKLSYSEHTLRSYVQQLRGEGFLTAGRPGSAGGELTEKTKQILRERPKTIGD